jgi:pimeloyl-ACP methyl ester carboxylesterase
MPRTRFTSGAGRAVLLASLVLSVLFVPARAVVAQEAPPADDFEVEVQYPFVCTTARNGLGQPKVDNQDAQGIPVAQEDAEGNYPKDDRGYPTAEATIVGWSRDCEVDTQYHYLYKTAGEDGEWVRVEQLSAVPADGVATTTTTDGDTVPLIARMERGTINRFIYSAAMLVPADEADPADPDTSLWNRRLVFSLQGGVAIGHTQGNWSQSAALFEDALVQGYAVINSTGTRTNTHYNLRRGGQTAVMTKDHFVEVYGEPDYTIGVGGSGGAIQQYVYSQNHPGLLDGGVPQYSYPDMVTQTIHVGDCELLEHYFERTDAANPRWRNVEEREQVLGLNAEQDPVLGDSARGQLHALYGLYRSMGIPTPNGWSPDDPSVIPVTECRPAWYGLTPLAMNPTFTNVSDIDKLAEGTEDVDWTHWDDARDVYGVDEEGWARQPWDNVGVQYGLAALQEGRIAPEEFLRLNSLIGGWKHASEQVEEGFPFRGAPTAENFDPWSSRQMNLSPDGTTPAARTQGDPIGIENAWQNGHVFRGELDIPLIDWRHYLEHQLDMHNSIQSFAARQRMDRTMGHHENQLVWFTDARPDQRQSDETMDAFAVLHDWITNIKANPDAGVAANKPAAAVDKCFETDGTLIAEGDDVWDGTIDDAPPGACTQRFEIKSTSRVRAGGPITGDVFKCRTMPVATAAAEGLYGSWQPDAAAIERLAAIHPEGVCDYSLPGVGEPGVEVAEAPTATTAGGGVNVEGAEPGATVALRRAGTVVASATADSGGRAHLGPVGLGTYVVSQTVDGQRSALSAPVAIEALLPIDTTRLCEAGQGQEPPFDDIVGTTFEQDISCLALAGITNGVTPDAYSPTTDVTRGQMASFIANLIDTAAALATEGSPVEGLPAYDGTNRFSDVAPSDVHLANINRLADAGIVLGGPGGTAADRYGPGQRVSRAQMASFVARALSHLTGEQLEGEGDFFGDDDGDVHEPNIDLVAQLGVAVGVDAERFDPGSAITRGQMAAFLVRALAVLEVRGHITPLPAPQVSEAFLPVVFVHGQSGSAQQFESQFLRFTSNGYPQELLFAYEYSTATGTNDLEQLDAFIDDVLAQTGAEQVYAVGHSRGTSVLTSYLEPGEGGVDGSSKVAKYVNIDGRSPAELPGGVPSIGIWGEWNTAGSGFNRREGDTNAQIGPDPAANFYFGDKSHTEVATSAAAFEVIFEFLAEQAPEHLDVVPAPTDDITIAGRAVLFPQNEGYDGATVEAWAVDPATGQRTEDDPVASQVVDETGDFGPFPVQQGVHYELAIVRPDSPNVHHFYFEPFIRDDHFVRLLTSRPGEGIAALIPTSEQTTNVIVFRMRELWGDQGAASDEVSVDGVSVVNPTTSPRSDVNLVLFGFDDGDDLVTDLGKGIISPFDAIGFLTAVDLAIPASPEGSGSVPVVQTVRGGPETVTLNIPDRPSARHANSVLFWDFTGGTG